MNDETKVNQEEAQPHEPTPEAVEPEPLAEDASEAQAPGDALPTEADAVEPEVASSEVAEAEAAEPEVAAPEAPEAAPAPAEPGAGTQAGDASKSEETPDGEPRQKKSGRRERKNREPAAPDVSREIKHLIELATKYPEIGAPLAELSAKLGYHNLSERLLGMGLEDDERGTEFFIVSANRARKEGRSKDVLEQVLAGLKNFAANDSPAPDVKTRLLHLVRMGFAVLLFDLEDIRSEPEYMSELAQILPALAEHYTDNAFYMTLLAMTQWFESPETSEATWDQAATLGEAETTWNSRGTWYKEAEKDLARAEGAYRSGLKVLPTSELLLHNLGQVLTDRAEQAGEEDVEQKRNWLREAESLLRQAYRRARRHSMRRHINGNIERVKTMQQKLPREQREPVKPPEMGDVVNGRVNNIKDYGVFVSLGNGLSGLIHKSELAHAYVENPNDHVTSGETIEVKVIELRPIKGGQGVRIGLSRKAVLPEPEGEEAEKIAAEAAKRQRRPRGDGQRRRNQNNRSGANPNNAAGSAGGGSGGGNSGGGNRRGSSEGGASRRGGRNQNGRNQNANQGANQNANQGDGLGSLGELLLAKLEEKKNN